MEQNKIKWKCYNMEKLIKKYQTGNKILKYVNEYTEKDYKSFIIIDNTIILNERQQEQKNN